MTTYTLSLLFLLGYQYPKASFGVAMLLAYMILSTIFDSIISAFFTTPVNRLPLAIALILVTVAWYLHRLIKEYDQNALRDAVVAAELAALGQAKFLGYGEESGGENESSSGGEQDGFAGRPRSRERIGGLDTDVWQGGQRLKRRGWTPKKA